MNATTTGLVEIQPNFNLEKLNSGAGVYSDTAFARCDDIVGMIINKLAKPYEIREGFDSYTVEIQGGPKIHCYPPTRAGSIRTRAAMLEFDADGHRWTLRDREVFDRQLVEQFIAALS